MEGIAGELSDPLMRDLCAYVRRYIRRHGR
jgi:hypothetical protein